MITSLLILEVFESLLQLLCSALHVQDRLLEFLYTNKLVGNIWVVCS